MRPPSFRHPLSAALLGFVCLACMARASAPPSGAAARDTSSASRDSSILTIAGPKEPGTRMIVTGRILDRNGKKPVAGVRVGVYHTDVSGQYGVHSGPGTFPGGPARDARLSGWLITDRAGRFEIRTIRPGHYPGGSIPEHIHFVFGGGTQELRFADDPLMRHDSAPPESRSATVRQVTTDAKGVQHVSVDLRLFAPTSMRLEFP
jgi:protocatechuate 3,4-dioxygenase beta subunit